jgi:uncharacterized protein involved in exopolysaccharide biosynthesis
MAEASGELDRGRYIDAGKAVWKRIAATSGGFAVLAVIYHFVAAPVYVGKASVILEVDPVDAVTMFRFGAEAPSALDIIEGVIKSNPVQQSVRDATQDLTPDKKRMSEGDLSTLLTTTKEYKRNQVVLTVRNKDQKLILGVLESAILALKTRDKELNYSTAGKKAEYLVEAISDKENELDQAQADLSAYLTAMKAPSDPTEPGDVAIKLQAYKDFLETQLEAAKSQAKAAAEGALDMPTASSASFYWRTKINDLKFQLRAAEVTFGPAKPEVVKLQGQIAEAEKMAKEEVGKEIESLDQNLSTKVQDLELRRRTLIYQVAQAKVAAEAAPGEAVEIQRLYREVRTLEEVLVTLKRNYEARRVDAQIEKVRWDVLEDPYIKERPANKRPLFYTALAILLGAIFGTFWTMLRGGRTNGDSAA